MKRAIMDGVCRVVQRKQAEEIMPKKLRVVNERLCAQTEIIAWLWEERCFGG